MSTKAVQTMENIGGSDRNTPLLVRAEHLIDELTDKTRAVADRAFEFFARRGYEPGHAVEDWLRAETEIMRQVPVEIAEANGQFTVRAQVPGFKPEELKISVEPNRLIISGNTSSESERIDGEVVYTEWNTNSFCRATELPALVDHTRVTTKLSSGVLTVLLPKLKQQIPAQVEVKAE